MKFFALLVCFALALALNAKAAVTNPTFADRYDYASSTCPVRTANIATGDVNGDGIPDLICSGYVGPLTLLGNGDGTFRTGPASNIGNPAVSPVALDLNGDGKLDVIVVTGIGVAGPSGLGVLFGNGDGTFQMNGFYQTGTDRSPTFIVVGDFNGDGIMDMATETGAHVWVFLGEGGGAFRPGVPIALSESGGSDQPLAVSDVNGDGKLDIVASTYDTGVAVLLGNGDGTFKPEVDTAIPIPLVAFAMGDFNGDSKPDLFAVSNEYGNGLLYLGNGDGTFTLTRQVNIASAPFWVTAADVNGDGFLDIISSGSDVLFGNGKGYFSAPVFYPIASNGDAGYVVAADLRNNGSVDLIFSNFYGGLSILLNSGKGKFEDGKAVPVSGGSVYCAVSADFNGDGIPDLAAAVDSGTSILLGTGKSGSPYTQGQLLSYPLYSCPVIGDFNGDGIHDLLVTSGAGTAITFLGNGDGTFTQVAKTTPLSSNGTLVVGDFNGDGKLDFALNSNLLAYGNGDGTFQTPVPFIPQVISTNIIGIAAARLNADRESDVVLVDFVANLVYVLLSNGNKGFTQTTFNSATNGGCDAPINPVLADVNGDGKQDLVLGCDGPAVPIYLNNGAGAFTYSGVTLSGGIDTGFPLVADVNGDGIADIVVQDDFDLTIFPGLGSMTFGASTEIGTGSYPGHVLAVDAHRQRYLSGKPDLLVPDASGVVNVYFNTTK
jgi:hypothetical protein